MNRLTKRNGINYIARNKYCDYDAVLTDVQLESAYQQCVDKLGQLEDIEEELGIDLIKLFKALKQGYIYALFGNSIFKMQIDGINYNTGYLILYDEDNHNIFEWGEINAYGKTWVLAKEELENDK